MYTTVTLGFHYDFMTKQVVLYRHYSPVTPVSVFSLVPPLLSFVWRFEFLGPLVSSEDTLTERGVSGVKGTLRRRTGGPVKETETKEEVL